jgi:hypothetical protein
MTEKILPILEAHSGRSQASTERMLLDRGPEPAGGLPAAELSSTPLYRLTTVGEYVIVVLGHAGRRLPLEAR